jgi:hypothetical protein
LIGCGKKSEDIAQRVETTRELIKNKVKTEVFGHGVGKKVAGATEAISEEEGCKAKGAVENIDEISIKKLGE